MRKFFVYTKTPFTCTYHVEEAETIDVLAARLKADGVCWKLGKVFGMAQVPLSNMPHRSAVLLTGNAKSFIAVADAAEVSVPAYTPAESYWVMH